MIQILAYLFWKLDIYILAPDFPICLISFAVFQSHLQYNFPNWCARSTHSISLSTIRWKFGKFTRQTTGAILSLCLYVEIEFLKIGESALHHFMRWQRYFPVFSHSLVVWFLKLVTMISGCDEDRMLCDFRFKLKTGNKKWALLSRLIIIHIFSLCNISTNLFF